MKKKLAVEVIVEIRQVAGRVVALLAEAELASKTNDHDIMKVALEKIVESKREVLLGLSAVVGKLLGAVENESVFRRMVEFLKGK